MRATRRSFFGLTAAAGTLATGADAIVAASVIQPDREYWVETLDKIARPVISNLAKQQLRAVMPVEQKPGSGREKFSHLEAFGRLICGMAPWLGVKGLTGPEGKLQKTYIQQVQTCLDVATHPKSPDFMNFTDGGQALVDTAFLAQGLLRAPDVLWHPLPARVKSQIIKALIASRQAADPKTSNWVMFAAMVEAALLAFGQPTLKSRLEDNVRLMINWYCGDGAYGDGEYFHFDYYNALVIQPMLIDVLGVLKAHDAAFAPAYEIALQRSVRYAEVQERLISPDGNFPPLGRSLTYRYGAFQTLSQIALMQALPEAIVPAQVRCALTSVIKLLTGPATFDAKGWLTIGFYGHQPRLGEAYISTGSLYLCAAVFLALGLSPAAPFWAETGFALWTQMKLQAGFDMPADHAIKDVRIVDIPELKRG